MSNRDHDCDCPSELLEECPRSGQFGGPCDCRCHTWTQEELDQAENEAARVADWNKKATGNHEPESPRNVIEVLERPEQVNADPATRERVEHRRIVPAEWGRHWISYGGTYGMGGPGFFGLHLEATDDYPAEWLMLCLWGACDWLTINGRWLSCGDGQRDQQRPMTSSYTDDKWDEFGPLVLNGYIAEFLVGKDTTRLQVTGNPDTIIRLDQDPSLRPILQGSKEPRIVLPTDDLRKGAWKLVNTVSVEI